MAGNSKAVQAKADAKRAGKRARAWTAIVYPDSENTPKNWLDILREQLIECLISPLHDKDKNPDGEAKKPHYHVVLSFKNPTTYERACEVFEQVGAVIPPERECRVKDFRQMARYLCHMDQPDKHRYERSEVISIGSIDYDTLVLSSADETDILDQIFDAMDANGLITYPMVVRFVRDFHPEWKTVVYRKYASQISNYAKGLHFEHKENIRVSWRVAKERTPNDYDIHSGFQVPSDDVLTDGELKATFCELDLSDELDE